MRTETITQRILTADEGMMLTNGETCGKTVVLPVDADHTVWQEITEAQAQALMKTNNTEEENNHV